MAVVKNVRMMVAVLGFCLAAVAANAEMTGGLPIGDVAPDVEVTPLGQSPALLSRIQGNRPIAIFVFKTTCPSCQHEVAALNEAFPRLDPTRVAFLAVSVRESETSVRRFIEQFGAVYPIATDRDAKMVRPFNVQMTPSFFFLDAKRVVRFEGHEIPAQQIVDKLNQLVAESAAGSR